MDRMTFIFACLVLVTSSIGIAAADDVIPAFCNRVESRNSIDMTSVSLMTGVQSRFVSSGGSLPVELQHQFRISEREGIPSFGSASTSLDVLISEARTGTAAGGGGSLTLPSGQIEFHERLRVDGHISFFERIHHYESGGFR